MSISNGRYPKVRLVEQPSRKARELEEQLLNKDRLLEEAEVELDELMNCDSEQIQLLEDERRLLFQQKTAAEIRAERLQRRINELEGELHTLKSSKPIDRGVDRTMVSPTNAVDIKEAPSDDQSILPAFPPNDCGSSSLNNEGPKRDQQNPTAPVRNDASLVMQGLGLNIEGAYAVDAVPISVQSTSDLMTYPEDALKSKNAQKWFPAAFEYLNRNLGEGYANLFKKWVEFECSRGWASSTRGLARQNRPEELSKWILNCRYDRRGNEPELKTDDALIRFRECFVRWWKQLQQAPDAGELASNLEGWRNLDRSGKNGWLSVLACLKWWGTALGDQTDREGAKGHEWRTIVTDASLVLTNLIDAAQENV
ncbi:uncharacterized protein C8R40DRAFT_1165165 [Lentinula edodes]|uniref:uncharacterized protein n=1 Tax=Lentinula edodes TaxID=5353 RepID=UPI001E8D3D2C|nr:uncharacterized protein C8R40DRAFT_1165165 [Lentinula edodes]KAH7880256.1 hypothetical protein C8R40DRAFT_1165165 [Lentinula edodes]